MVIVRQSSLRGFFWYVDIWILIATIVPEVFDGGFNRPESLLNNVFSVEGPCTCPAVKAMLLDSLCIFNRRTADQLLWVQKLVNGVACIATVMLHRNHGNAIVLSSF